MGLCAIVLASCGGGPTPLAVIASSSGTIGVGEQRILVALVDPETTEYLASGDIGATALIRDEDGTPLETVDLEFVWTVPDVRGVYSARVDIPAPGTYQLTVDAEGFDESGPSGFVAVENPPMVGPGDLAPASETRVAADYPDLAVITSDPDPDEELYESSVADVVANGRPSVILFATPAFCQTQACGPMLEQVKALEDDYDTVDFVHVEVYEDLQVQSVEELNVVDAVVEWGLPSEPWVFIVDGSGIVVAAFEGAVNDQELVDILKGLGAR